MSRILLAASLLALAGCTSKLSKPPEVTSEGEKGSTELVFMLSDPKFNIDGSQSFTASGVHEGRPVSFEVRLGRWSENGPGFINMSTWDCTATLVSKGAPSDAFLSVLDQRYGTKLAPRAMAPTVECKALSPWENPGKLEHEPIKLVLMFSGGFDETRDAEVWLDVRPKESRVILREKDLRFRRALVLALEEPRE